MLLVSTWVMNPSLVDLIIQVAFSVSAFSRAWIWLTTNLVLPKFRTSLWGSRIWVIWICQLLAVLGFDPIGISHLTRLVALDLSSAYVPHINMYFHLATLVQNLSELRELYLDGVLVLEEGSGWCQHLSASLPNLSVLSMKNCGLSGPLDSCLSNLPKSLSVIRLDGNMFSAPVPEFFADFKNLTSLSFASCKLNGKFPEKILQIPTL